MERKRRDMMGQKCYKNGDCRCKGYDGICFFGKSCVYKEDTSSTASGPPSPQGEGYEDIGKEVRNEAQKSPVSDFAGKSSKVSREN